VAKAGKKKVKKSVQTGVVHIQSTFNNTIITIHRSVGRRAVLGERWWIGIQGVAQVDAVRGAGRGGGVREEGDGARRAHRHRVHQGPGSGRESAVRAIQAAGIKVTLIKDVTPIPHNGCRPKKRRRV
jgi:small subunit ribosomal protein S11